MTGWIKMKLGIHVNFDPGYIVLNGDPVPLPRKGAQQPPIFGPGIVAKRLDG